jgi:hypothetical protein
MTAGEPQAQTLREAGATVVELTRIELATS